MRELVGEIDKIKINMGGSCTYHEAGKTHSDTVSYKDEDKLAKIGHSPKRITAIRIWFHEYVVGIETFYDKITSGARMGTELLTGSVCEDFILDEKEYITEVSGRAGDVIDLLQFTTNYGKTVSWGNQSGGDPFLLSEPGKVVKGF